jgi:RNA polymerase sigma-70 factor (ECF subfamily)
VSSDLPRRNDFDHTRATLLERLRQPEDQAAWREFFDTYWPLLISVSRRSGLGEADAQDVAQDVLMMVARQMRDFRYDPARGAFKSWLLTLTRRRIARHWRHGEKERGLLEARPPTRTGETAFLERLPDRQTNPLDALWEAEWEQNTLEAALRRVRARVSARQFQIYTLAALQDVPMRTICGALGVHPAQVYLARHRVGRLVKAELRRLQKTVAGSNLPLKKQG